MTPKEFMIVCEENVERTHDERERMALQAIYNAAASNGIQEGTKKSPKTRLPSLKELYDRNSNAKPEDKQAEAEHMVEQQRHTEEWLAQYDLSNIK